MSSKLVAYFSASGITAGVAELLSEAIGAELFDIEQRNRFSLKYNVILRG